MIASYADAHRRINTILDFFVVGCATALALATVHGYPKFAIVWLFAGLIGYAIEASPNRSSFKDRPVAFGAESESMANGDALESAEEDAFCCKFLRFSFLLAVTAFLIGCVIGSPVWSNCIAGVFTWFISMLCLPLLCAPHDAEDES